MSIFKINFTSQFFGK